MVFFKALGNGGVNYLKNFNTRLYALEYRKLLMLPYLWTCINGLSSNSSYTVQGMSSINFCLEPAKRDKDSTLSMSQSHVKTTVNREVSFYCTKQLSNFIQPATSSNDKSAGSRNPLRNHEMSNAAHVCRTQMDAFSETSLLSI